MTKENPEGRGRILVLTSTFPRREGDAEPAFVFDLCRRLAERFEVTVLAPHASGARTAEIIAGMRVVRFRYGPECWERLAYEGGIMANLRRNPLLYLMLPPFFLAQLAALLIALRRDRPVAVHAHWIVPQGIVLAAALRLSGQRPRAVCTVHGSDISALRGALWTRVRRWAMARCDRVVAVSQPLRLSLAEEGCPPAKLDVIPMGVDLNGLFVPGRERRQDAALLFVGRLVPAKGADLLMRALAELDGRYPRATLTVVGSGPEADRLASLARSLGIGARVTFAGSLAHAQLAELYRRASLLVLPSLEEGFGLVLAEAMGCGCPVAASDLPALRDMIEDGRSGRLFRPGDVADMARVVAELLADPRSAQAMAEEARRRVAARFDWAGVAQRYAAALMPAWRGDAND